jgi:hypothetical protein
VKVSVRITVSVTIELSDSHGILYTGVKWGRNANQPTFRDATHTREVDARRGETQRRQAAARLNWRASDQPAWLNEETYREKIQPRLAEISVPIISSALGVSKPYATDIRAGRGVRVFPKYCRSGRTVQKSYSASLHNVTKVLGLETTRSIAPCSTQ